MKDNSKVRKIAFVGDHLPRKCGIATFTSDLLAAVAAAHPQSQCLSVTLCTHVPHGLATTVRPAIPVAPLAVTQFSTLPDQS
jgi:hypothetical protein